MAWIRDPLVLCFVLGVLLFFAYRWFAAEPLEPVTLSAAGRAVLLQEFEMLSGRSPSGPDIEREVARYYEREVLFREALRRGLERSDSGVREVLIERMQQAVSGELVEPDARDLVVFYGRHLSRYYREASLTLEQVFFEKHPADPQAVLHQLNTLVGANTSTSTSTQGDSGPVVLVATGTLGDTPWQGRKFPDYGHSMLRGLFGEALLSLMRELPIQQWAGPFESVDGWHFFYVTDRKDAVPLAFAQVREQVLIDYQSQRLQERIQQFVDTRRDRYPLQLEP